MEDLEQIFGGIFTRIKEFESAEIKSTYFQRLIDFCHRFLDSGFMWRPELTDEIVQIIHYSDSQLLMSFLELWINMELREKYNWDTDDDLRKYCKINYGDAYSTKYYKLWKFVKYKHPPVAFDYNDTVYDFTKSQKIKKQNVDYVQYVLACRGNEAAIKHYNKSNKLNFGDSLSYAIRSGNLSTAKFLFSKMKAGAKVLAYNLKEYIGSAIMRGCSLEFIRWLEAASGEPIDLTKYSSDCVFNDELMEYLYATIGNELFDLVSLITKYGTLKWYKMMIDFQHESKDDVILKEILDALIDARDLFIPKLDYLMEVYTSEAVWNVTNSSFLLSMWKLGHTEYIRNWFPPKVYFTPIFRYEYSDIDKYLVEVVIPTRDVVEFDMLNTHQENQRYTLFLNILANHRPEVANYVLGGCRRWLIKDLSSISKLERFGTYAARTEIPPLESLTDLNRGIVVYFKYYAKYRSEAEVMANLKFVVEVPAGYSGYEFLYDSDYIDYAKMPQIPIKKDIAIYQKAIVAEYLSEKKRNEEEEKYFRQLIELIVPTYIYVMETFDITVLEQKAFEEEKPPSESLDLLKSFKNKHAVMYLSGMMNIRKIAYGHYYVDDGVVHNSYVSQVVGMRLKDFASVRHIYKLCKQWKRLIPDAKYEAQLIAANNFISMIVEAMGESIHT